MPIINARDNENNRWKGNAKTRKTKKQNIAKQKTKAEKNKGGTEAVVKRWGLNGFVVYLSSPINM